MDSEWSRTWWSSGRDRVTDFMTESSSDDPNLMKTSTGSLSKKERTDGSMKDFHHEDFCETWIYSYIEIKNLL